MGRPDYENLKHRHGMAFTGGPLSHGIAISFSERDAIVAEFRRLYAIEAAARKVLSTEGCGWSLDVALGYLTKALEAE